MDAHVQSLPHMHALKCEHSHTHANLKHREHKIKLRAEEVAQCFPSILEALGSVPSMA